MIDPKPGHHVEPDDMSGAPDEPDVTSHTVSHHELDVEEEAARLGDFA